jgi:VanZ family protein
LAIRLRAWGPAAAWATVLFLLSAWSNPVVPRWISEYDKLAHFGLYAILGLALGYGRHRDPASPAHLLPLAFGALYGATDEWHQAFTYGRTPGWGDWIADMMGVSFGYFLALFILIRVAPAAATTSGVDVAD